MAENGLKVVNKIENQEKIIRKAVGVKQTFFTFLPNYLINLGAIVAILLMSLIAFNYSWSYIWSWNTLITILILSVIYTLSHWSIYDYRLKKLRLIDENQKYFDENEKKIEDIVGTHEWVQHRDEFISERNMTEKIEEWKHLTTLHLQKLKDKAKAKDVQIANMQVTEIQRKHLSEEEVIELELQIEHDKQHCAYLQKRLQYEEMIQDEWIVKNINKINIDYNEIDSLFIEKGSIVAGRKRDKTKQKGKYLKETMSMRFVMIGITLFISIFFADLWINKFDSQAWFIFSLRMVTLLYNVIMGLNYGDKFFTEVDVHNSDSRLSITKEFKSWCIKKKYVTN